MITRAFPSKNTEDGFEHYGMELRDYFACHAMQSLINEKYWHEPRGDIDVINIATDSYRMANAMMEARKNGK